VMMRHLSHPRTVRERDSRGSRGTGTGRV
jgi:hypothetical protein